MNFISLPLCKISKHWRSAHEAAERPAPNRCSNDWNEGSARTGHSKHRQNAVRKASFSTASTHCRHQLPPRSVPHCQSCRPFCYGEWWHLSPLVAPQSASEVDGTIGTRLEGRPEQLVT